ncbi:nitroreductase family protein [Caproiciproducens sp.]|uniref:nitroreductase family protein n=1 Tax=Caproiciproducens sp. TaxID=1954376 RepID=UPI003FA42EE4
MAEINEVMRQIRERKSVRVFEKKDVPQFVKDEIISAALQAPTAGNMMLYTIIDVTDQEIKNQLSLLCDNQPFIAKAPMVFVFLADYQKWYDLYQAAGLSARKPGPGDLLLSCADAIIAAQNSVVAAQSYGLGSCYIGDVLENCEQVKQLLDLPEYAVPAAMVVYGYPTKQQLERKKPPRFQATHIVHTNSYRKMSDEELLAMYGEQDTNESIKNIYERKYTSEFALEMNRSASEYLGKF